MGNKAWTTEPQRTWLEAQIPDFVQVQESKAVAIFLKDLSNKWEDKWPTSPPTEGEIKKSKGVTEKAVAIKQKATECVHTHERTRFDADAWSSSI
jgi:hypothetical protein